MRFLPNFLNIWPAAAAAAIVVPSLLVLYFLKLRRREMNVPSTLLWRKAIQDLQVNAPFQRLRRNLLLLLQLLLLLLLSLALSQPVVSFSPGAGTITVILIDRSASMSATDYKGKSRLDEAKRRARDLVGTLRRISPGVYAQAMVIAFDDSAETLQPLTSDVNSLRTAIDSIQPTDRKSRLKLAYQLAEASTAFNPAQLRSNGPRPEVWLYSDGRVLDASELTLHADLRYDKIGTDKAGNVAIVALSAKRNYERPTEVQVFARLANFGPDPIKDVPVQLTVDGQTRSVASTTLVPERWTDDEREKVEKEQGLIGRDSIEFPPLELTSSAIIRVEQMAKEGDVLSADDAAWVVVPPPKNLSVLLVTDGNYFLERAMDSLNLKKPDHISPGDYEDKIPDTYDVIVFDSYSPRKLPPAGAFIYFGGAPPGLKLKASVETDSSFTMQKDVTVLDWKRDHPILRGLHLDKLYADQAIKFMPTLDTEVLMDGMTGPLIMLHREGRGTHLVVAFDLLHSNWPMKVSFPIFIQNSLQYLAVGSEMDVRQSFEPGSSPRIPHANIQRMEGAPKKITLLGPDDLKKLLPVPDSGDFALPPLDKVGMYHTDPPVPQFEHLAVNLLDANESNLLPNDKPPGGSPDALIIGSGKSRLELWWWIVACAALPLLLIEWWVYTRRVHL